ncbi:MAG: GNAT family N-acetyltransferase [Zoogloeaceae bacterium]|jgi:ribosomal protein S18 acetylase RimI-like enzyme|nr:GNAT family N-acetyltransferase [Zoogloeaceae bacterium]
MRQFLTLVDTHGQLIQREWFDRAESVHRQLHDHFPEGREAYYVLMMEIFQNGGRMYVLVEDQMVKGVVVARLIVDSRDKRHWHLDDVVVDQGCRDQGIGQALLRHMEEEARARNCQAITLDSRVARERAHRFYFREGFMVKSFHFLKNCY